MTYNEIVDLINANLVDNSQGLITPIKHRQALKAVLDYIQAGGDTLLAEGVITSAQILNSFTSPVVLIPAPGAGKLIWIDSIGYINGAGTEYETNTSGFFGYAGFSFPDGLANDLGASNRMNMNQQIEVSGTAEFLNTINKAIEFNTDVGNPTTGTFDIFYSIKYRIIDNPF